VHVIYRHEVVHVVQDPEETWSKVAINLGKGKFRPSKKRKKEKKIKKKKEEKGKPQVGSGFHDSQHSGILPQS